MLELKKLNEYNVSLLQLYLPLHVVITTLNKLNKRNTRISWHNAGWSKAHRLPRWPNIHPTLDQRLVLVNVSRLLYPDISVIIYFFKYTICISLYTDIFYIIYEIIKERRTLKIEKRNKNKVVLVIFAWHKSLLCQRVYLHFCSWCKIDDVLYSVLHQRCLNAKGVL